MAFDSEAMKGWILVRPEGLARPEALAKWVAAPLASPDKDPPS